MQVANCNFLLFIVCLLSLILASLRGVVCCDFACDVINTSRVKTFSLAPARARAWSTLLRVR